MVALTAIATIGLLAGLASTSLQVKNQMDANKDAKQAQKDQQGSADALLKEGKDKAAADAQTSINAATLQQAKARQLANMAGAGGRGSTILTSPLGGTGTPNAPGKQLLGM